MHTRQLRDYSVLPATFRPRVDSISRINFPKCTLGYGGPNKSERERENVDSGVAQLLKEFGDFVNFIRINFL